MYYKHVSFRCLVCGNKIKGECIGFVVILLFLSFITFYFIYVLLIFLRVVVS